VQQNTIHHIRTTPGPPVACSPRRLALDCKAVAKAEFNTMLRDGTAQNIDKGPWPPALHLLPKKGNRLRLYGDYRALNTRTIPDRYPIRHTNKYAHHHSGCTIVSKIDLMRAYHQIPVHPEDIQKAVITTPYPSWHFSISFYVLWPEERHPNLSMIHGQDPERPKLLFRLWTTSLSSIVPPRAQPASPCHLTQPKTYGTSMKTSKCAFRVPEISFPGHKTSS
jgi:hypothetical protein